jgi:peptide-methionine (R)-S-oxide reductase
MKIVQGVLVVAGLVALAGCRPASSPVADGRAVSTATNPASAASNESRPAEQGAETIMSTNAESGASSQAARIEKTDAQWRAELSPEQYRILREKGTERAFTGKYWDTPSSYGEYRCAACNSLLFRGADKFVSECGWPAFDKAIKGSIKYHADRSFGMLRTEVTCSRCDGHLGHVFEDGPTDTTGVRYCINSLSITYTPLPDETKTKDLPTEAIVDPK